MGVIYTPDFVVGAMEGRNRRAKISFREGGGDLKRKAQ